jgi:molybdate transport system substrate-binding protein
MKILCTNGLKSIMRELVPAFERGSASKVAVTWGATNALLKELESGSADGDLAVLTAEAIDGLIKQGKVVSGSRVDIAGSGIGLAVRKGAPSPDIGSPDALKKSLLAAKSVAHSKVGLSGIYFPTVLARLGIAEAMRGKIVLPDPGTPVGELVAKGEAEIGVQQISELLPVAGIEMIGPLPPPLQKVTTFSAGVLAGAGEPEAAKALVNFVVANAPSLLEARGLQPVERSA